MAIAISEALDQLSERLPRAVRAYELREYGGYGYEEILELMKTEYRTKALLAADLTLVRKSLVALLRGTGAAGKCGTGGETGGENGGDDETRAPPCLRGRAGHGSRVTAIALTS